MKEAVRAVLLAASLLLIHRLLLIPASLDASLPGILFFLTVAALAYFLQPAERRRAALIEAATYLLVAESLARIPSENSPAMFIAQTVITLLFLLLFCRLFGPVPFRRSLPAFAVIVVSLILVPANQMLYLTEFQPPKVSQSLASGGSPAGLGLIPMQIVEGEGSGSATTDPIATWQVRLGDEGLAGRVQLDPVMLRTSGNALGAMPADQRGVSALHELGPLYLGVPFLKAEFTEAASGGVRSSIGSSGRSDSGPAAGTSTPSATAHSVTLTPLLDRIELAEQFTSFGAAPWLALELGRQSLESNVTLWYGSANGTDEPSSSLPDSLVVMDYKHLLPVATASSPTSSSEGLEKVRLLFGQLHAEWKGKEHRIVVPEDSLGIVAAVQLLPKSSLPQVILRGQNAFHVVDLSPDAAKQFPSLTEEDIPGIGSADLLAADIDNDGVVELLINAERAEIVSWSDSVSDWTRLWRSSRASLRFETVLDKTSGTKATLVGLSPSWLRDHPTRYLTGFHWENNELNPVWKIFPTGLVNIRTVDVGGKAPGLAAQIYGEQRILLLQPHGIPVTAILYLLLLGYMIVRLRSAWMNRRRRRLGGRVQFSLLPLTSLLVLACVLAGCSISSQMASGQPLSPPPAEKQAFQPAFGSAASLPEPPAGEAHPATADELADRLRSGLSNADTVERLRFTGWTATRVGRNRTTHMYNGLSLPGEGAQQADIRLLGEPYRYFRIGERSFLFEGKDWSEVRAPAREVEPFGGFEQWIDLVNQAERVERLPDGKVLAQPTDVYRFVLMEERPNAATIEATIWLGKEDHLPRQYAVRTTWPTVGSNVIQETTFRFWDFNARSIAIDAPAGLRELLR